MISETGLANMANANDDKVFFYSRFSERPWALRKKAFDLEHYFFRLKKQKRVVFGKEDDNITTI